MSDQTFDPANNTAPASTESPTAPAGWEDIPEDAPAMPEGNFTGFEDDEPETPVGETEATPEGTVPSAEPSGEAAPESPAEPVVETPDADPSVKQKAQAFDVFDKQIRENPGAFAATIVDNMDAAARTAFLKSLGVTPAGRTPFDLENYEPNGEMEQALAERWGDIDTIPQLVTQQQQIAADVKGNLEFVTPYLNGAFTTAEVAMAKIDAICDALGISLGDPDMKAIAEALKDGRTTFRSAVRKHSDYTKAVEAHKQSRAPRPQTPGNTSRRPDAIAAGTSMEEISRKFGLIK